MNILSKIFLLISFFTITSFTFNTFEGPGDLILKNYFKTEDNQYQIKVKFFENKSSSCNVDVNIFQESFPNKKITATVYVDGIIIYTLKKKFNSSGIILVKKAFSRCDLSESSNITIKISKN